MEHLWSPKLVPCGKEDPPAKKESRGGPLLLRRPRTHVFIRRRWTERQEVGGKGGDHREKNQSTTTTDGGICRISTLPKGSNAIGGGGGRESTKGRGGKVGPRLEFRIGNLGKGVLHFGFAREVWQKMNSPLF